MKTSFYIVSEPWIRSSFFKFRCSVCNKNRGNQIRPTTIFSTTFFLKIIPNITEIHADQKTSHPHVKNLRLQIYQQSHKFCQESVPQKPRIPSNFLASRKQTVKISHLNTVPRAPMHHLKSRPTNTHQPRTSVVFHALSRAPVVEEDSNRHVNFKLETKRRDV